MSLMNNINIEQIKKLISDKKYYFIGGVVFLFIVILFLAGGNNNKGTIFEKVELANLNNLVKATGQVVSSTDLSLSFNKAGTVRNIKVQVGDKAKKGDILATLDQGQSLASLTQAQANLLSARARYQKTLEGNTSEEIKLAQVSLDNAISSLENTKKEQNLLVANAYNVLLNSNLEAVPEDDILTNYTPPVIGGNYILGKEGDLKINIYRSSGGSGLGFSLSGVAFGSGGFNYNFPQPLGDTGLTIKMPTESTSNLTTEWVIRIPNTKASNYLTNYNNYQNALKSRDVAISSAESLVAQRQAELDIKKAKARPADLSIASAEVLNAEAGLQSAQASYEDTVIRAPANGTITKVDIKYGEIAQALNPVIVLQDIDNLYIEALINESNIANLKIGQKVAITFDAFGSDKKYEGELVHIDPSAVASDGVVNYKTKISFVGDASVVRSGMNANVEIFAGSVENVLAISDVALIKRDGKTFVNVVTNSKNKKYTEREVIAGFLGDSNKVEIKSGLNLGEEVVVLKK